MFGWFRRRRDVVRKPLRAGQLFIEGLETRQLLSSGPALQPNLTYLASSTSSTTIAGYTPSQILKGYGFDKINLGSGVAANGKGQTIAIIDAYNDPNITADLKVFDQQFGIADPPSMKIVNQTAGSKLPATDSGWAGEIALDVEWAHAIAPAANILLVEANSSSVDDLMAGVNTARHTAGVSVVSMSWGGSEFFSWGFSSGESQSQTTYDPIFTTPSGHQGVTFVASAGDSGSFAGVQWPASSPNVLSVGGTSLYLQSDGTYSSESGWSGTSSGFSVVEAKPSWQAGVQASNARSVADVAYDADPNTGFAVYDSLADQGYSGWQEVGGTSAGAPQWAALIAIANQGRALANLGTLDGAGQTMSILYSLYSAPGTTGYSDYTSAFNDVSSGGGSGYRFRWGGYGRSGSATQGYDTVTGLGSPKADKIVAALTGKTITSGSGTSTGGSTSGSGTTSGSGSSGGSGSGSTTTTVAQLPASPLTTTLLSAPTTSVITGSSGWVKVRITNSGDTKFTGPITTYLYASTDASYSTDDTYAGFTSAAQLNLKPGASKVIKVKFDYPQVTDGNYYLVAQTNAVGTNTAASEAVSDSTLAIAAPTVDLATTFADGLPIALTAGKNGTATVTVQNLGNETATGTLTLNLYASADGSIDSSSQVLTTLPNVKIKLKPGHTMTFHVRFVAPADQLPGTYGLVASIDSSTQLADANPDNDIAAIDTMLAA